MSLRFLTARLMERRSQVITPAWALVSCAVVSVGLGYIITSCRRLRKTIGNTKLSRSGSGDRDVVQTETPHPDWNPGQNQPRPEGNDKGHISLDPRDLRSCYSLIISAVVPRPIAFVSTQAPDGTVNVSPFSYFNAVGHDPPTLAFSVCRKAGGVKKDTLNNIEANGQFVVSIMSEWFIESANHTCGNFPPEVDEMALAGLTREKSTIVSPPRVKESAVNMECEVRHTYDIVNSNGECTTTVVFGEVVMFHVLPHLLNEAGAGEGKPTVNLKGYKPMARLGGNTYATLGSVFDLRRPSVK